MLVLWLNVLYVRMRRLACWCSGCMFYMYACAGLHVGALVACSICTHAQFPICHTTLDVHVVNRFEINSG